MDEFLLTSAVSMAVLLGLYHLLLEREKMHRFNRSYLIASLVFSLALPFVSITIPEYVEMPVPEPVTEYEPVTAVENGSVTYITPEAVIPPTTPAINYLPYIAIGLYGLVTLLLAVRFVMNIRHFYRVKARNNTIRYKGATLVLIDEKILPYTFLSNIYLNREEYEARSIEPELFTHELTHVKQRHTLDILFIELLRTIMWFNPLLFLYKRAIRLNHEFLADDRTIDQHRNIPTYQKLLLGKSGPATVFTLASSINFGTTKKRFIMMTKTTNKTKGLLLRLAVLPVAGALTFVLAAHTVVYGKTAPGLPPVVLSEGPNSAVQELFMDEELPETQETPAATVADSATTRRDEYYKGVRVIIDDKSRHLLIDKPYEDLTNEEKTLYLIEAPEKKERSEMTQKDFDFFLSEKDAMFYIDDRKVSIEAIKKHDPKDFATYRFTMSNVDGTRLMQIFCYLPKYFEKHIRHSQDRYPDKIYKVTILDKALDYTESRRLALDPPNGGKTDLDMARERIRKEGEKEKYSYSEFVKDYNTTHGPRFPGGSDKFYKYFEDNFSMKDKVGDKELFITMSINTDGTVSEVSVRDVAPEVGDEIKKVLESSPKWIPAQQNGQPLKMGYTINYPEKHK